MTDGTATERWIPVPGYDGDYEVSDLGRVRSYKWSRPRILRVSESAGGYLAVTLCMRGVRRRTLVHTIVTRAFIGPRPLGTEVRHLDGNNTHNALANLAYGTKSQNARDTLIHGTHSQARKTHCPQGHPYDDVNTYWWRGYRWCRICRAVNKAASDERKRVSL